MLPQYSGGLGILAGDHLKAASDLGVPIIGVGLLYRQGYFRQSLNAAGWQQERYPLLDPNSLPLTLLHDEGGPVRIEVPLAGRTLFAQVWVAQVGRVPLLMLDSDVEQNAGYEREVTDRLYGGGTDHRLEQEVLLGMGGVRAIRAYCRITGAPPPAVFHTNEGHAGFLGLERIREYMHTGDDFDTALGAHPRRHRLHHPYPGSGWHRPVPTRADRSPVRGLPGSAAGSGPGPGRRGLRGRRPEQVQHGGDGLPACPACQRRLFAPWLGVPRDVPGAVACVRHQRGADQRHHQRRAPSHLGAPRLLDLLEAPSGSPSESDGYDWNALDEVDSKTIWALKRRMREDLIAMTRARLAASSANRGMPTRLGRKALNPDVVTFGFARRVPSYKRLTLMLRDPARLKALLTDEERPIQIVIAGKAHPADEGGKALIQQIVQFADDPAVREHIVFLPDYDMAMAKRLYPGCDVWMNNPLRPYEACGTSGMKAALNGAANLSIRDGWWDEWFDPAYGWEIPSAEGADGAIVVMISRRRRSTTSSRTRSCRASMILINRRCRSAGFR